MQRAPFTGLSLLPATQLGVSLIGQLQWSTANACLQSVSTEPFTQPAGVQTDPIWEEERDRTIYRNRRRLLTRRWKSTGLVTRVGTAKTNVAKQSGTFFSLSLKASCLFWRGRFYTYVGLGVFHIDQIYTAGYKINIYFLRKQHLFRIFLRCDRWNIFCLERYVSCIGLDWLHFYDHSQVKRSFMSGNCVT